ncbi:MAG TPA: CRISPR-associated protein Cas4 [Firmicutes bacterium]|nr:CRISPR-associated protein Cas4 [Bacillota bacterium]
MVAESSFPDQSSEIRVNGTLVWYYFICQREVWLMGHQLNPDEDNACLEIGRLIQETTYLREKKEINLGFIKLDIIRKKGAELVVGEVKKSSKYKESARMQLAFYLKELKARGLNARGELYFPEEKRKEKVYLDEETERKLAKVERDILRILYLDTPPEPQKIHWCRRCAYAEFCWA